MTNEEIDKVINSDATRIKIRLSELLFTGEATAQQLAKQLTEDGPRTTIARVCGELNTMAKWKWVRRNGQDRTTKKRGAAFVQKWAIIKSRPMTDRDVLAALAKSRKAPRKRAPKVVEQLSFSTPVAPPEPQQKAVRVSRALDDMVRELEREAAAAFLRKDEVAAVAIRDAADRLRSVG